MEVYLSQNGQQYGPYTVDQIKELHSKGKISTTALLCNDGQNWISVNESEWLTRSIQLRTSGRNNKKQSTKRVTSDPFARTPHRRKRVLGTRSRNKRRRGYYDGNPITGIKPYNQKKKFIILSISLSVCFIILAIVICSFDTSTISHGFKILGCFLIGIPVALFIMAFQKKITISDAQALHMWRSQKDDHEIIDRLDNLSD